MVISNPAWRFSSASNRPAMALLNVSGIRFGDSSASPRPMPAPAKVNDGRIVRWSRAPRPVRKASTRRSHSPAEAVSSMTSHLRALARSPNTVSITVFPVPRAPVTSIMRPGAPTPLSRPFSKSRITLPRPMSRGGSPHAVGLNGFSFAFMWTASSLNQPKIKIIKNIKKIKIIKSWVEPTEENSRGDNDSAAIRGDNN